MKQRYKRESCQWQPWSWFYSVDDVYADGGRALDHGYRGGSAALK